MFKKPCFRAPFNRQHRKWVETLLQSERQHLFNIYQSLWRQLRWEKSLLVIYQILKLCFNTLTADDKDSVLNRDNLTQPIQMRLSQKQKTFFTIFFGILKCVLNFKPFTRRDDPHRLCISSITGSEKHGQINV